MPFFDDGYREIAILTLLPANLHLTEIGDYVMFVMLICSKSIFYNIQSVIDPISEFKIPLKRFHWNEVYIRIL